MADLQLRRYSNQAPETALNGAISASDTTITVDSVSGFPSVPYTLEIENEVLEVTGVSGLDLTVIRAFDGTTAAIHADGVTVRHVLTADDFEHRWQDTIVTRNWADLDDEFDDGTIDSAYTKVNLGTSTWTEANGVLSAVYSGQASQDVAAQVKNISGMAVGSGIQTAVRVFADADFAMAGVVLASGWTTTDNAVFQTVYLTPSTQTMTATLRSGTFTALSTTHYNDTIDMIGGWLHMRLIWVTVNQFRAWWSLDGVSWTPLGQSPYTITGISPPTQMGVGVSAWGSSTDKLATFEYLRVYEQ